MQRSLYVFKPFCGLIPRRDFSVKEATFKRTKIIDIERLLSRFSYTFQILAKYLSSGLRGRPCDGERLIA